MSPEKSHLPGLRQLLKRLRPAARRIRPSAKKTRTVAREKVHQGRAWAAPKVERSGHILQETVAPKVSSLLASAAHRIDPRDHDGGPARSEGAGTAEGGDDQPGSRAQSGS